MMIRLKRLAFITVIFVFMLSAAVYGDITEEQRAEAAALWDAFYKSVEHMNGDEAYTRFFKVYDVWEKWNSEQYAKHTDGTAEEWIEFSLFERFIRYETYIRIVDFLSSGNYDMYFDSERSYKVITIESVLNSLPRYNKEGAEAYEKLMMWQYEFIKNNHDVYNFMTGLSYREDMVVGAEFDPIAENKERKRAEYAEIAEDIAGIERELEHIRSVESDSDNGGSGIWLIILPLLVVLGGLVGVIVYIRNKKSNLP